MAQSKSVKAILSAEDKGFSKAFSKADNMLDSFQSKVSSGLGFGVLIGIGQKAFEAISSGIGGMVGELDDASKAWQTFEKNMQINGHAEDEIKAIKKELQSFAETTIYSSSDMASTFAQLDAVGIDSAQDLVKAFGGLAAASSEPKQAMKTLSTQAVQMAAKPKIAWMDFKLMLEQTPAGIAAVAKTMGMSTAQLVSAVQDGKVKTQDFFDAIKQTAGAGTEFAEMATQYKTIGQAMDGLTETISNKLLPVYQKLSEEGIKRVVDLTDTLANSIDRLTAAFDSGGLTGVLGELLNMANELPGPIKALGAVGGAAFANMAASKVLNPQTFSAVSNAASGAFSAMSGGFKALSSGAMSFGSKAMTVATKGITKFQLITGAINPGSVGQNFWSSFNGLTSGASSKISGITNKIKKSFIGKIANITGAIGEKILSVGGKVTSGLGTLMQMGLKAVMPAAMIAAVIAGLGVLYHTYGSQINSIINMVIQKGPEMITGFVSSITSQIPLLVNSGTVMIQKILEGIAVLMPSILTGGAEIITTLVDSLAKNAPFLIDSAVAVINQFVLGLASVLPEIIVSGLNLIAALAQGIGNNLPEIAATAFDAILKFVDGIIDHLPEIIDAALKIIKSLATGLIQSFPTIVEKGGQLIQKLLVGIGKAIPLVLTAFFDLGNNIISEVSKIDLWAAGKAIIDGFLNGLKSAFDSVKDFVGGIGSWIAEHKGPLSYDKRLLIPAGQAIMSGLDKGLSTAFSAVKSRVSSMGDMLASMMGNSYDLAFAGVGRSIKPLNMNAALDETAEYTMNSTQTIIVPVQIDGKEFARVTAEYTQDALKDKEELDKRLRGE